MLVFRLFCRVCKYAHRLVNTEYYFCMTELAFPFNHTLKWSKIML